MTAPSVFGVAGSLLDGHFATDPAKRKGGYLTAYAAVKKAFGVDRDDHPVAYDGPDWPKLGDAIDQAFTTLDEITAERSERPQQFIVWCTRPDRTYGEVAAVLAEAARRRPDLVIEREAELRAATRTKPPMPGSRKLKWVICNQIGTVAVGRASSIGNVVHSILPCDGLSDWEVLRRLDDIIANEALANEAPSDTEVHVNLARAWASEALRALPFCEAIGVVGSRALWESESDEQIDERLVRITRESAADDLSAESSVLLA